MEQHIADGKVGEVGAYTVDFANGKLVAKLDAAKAEVGLKAGVHLELDGGIVLDALAKAIPGTIDDVFLGVLKAALAAPPAAPAIAAPSA